MNTWNAIEMTICVKTASGEVREIPRWYKTTKGSYQPYYQLKEVVEDLGFEFIGPSDKLAH